ncbi:MAG: alpha/beta fold hydrolase [Litorivicinus sp.]
MSQVVWLPGTLCDERLFAPQRAALGAGVVPDVSQFDSVTSQAHAVWQSLGPGSVKLVGLSYGGILALEMIRQQPQRVTHLAVLDSNARSDTGEKQRQRNALIEQLIEGQFESIVMEQLKPLYLGCKQRDNSAILNTVRDMALSQGQAVLERQVRAVRDRPDQRSYLPQIQVPTLILAGQEDVLCPPDRQHEMHQMIARSQLVLLPDCGHLSTLEASEAVNQALATLFKR